MKFRKPDRASELGGVRYDVRGLAGVEHGDRHHGVGGAGQGARHDRLQREHQTRGARHGVDARVGGAAVAAAALDRDLVVM